MSASMHHPTYCPLCGPDGDKNHFMRSGYDLVQCGCGLVFLNSLSQVMDVQFYADAQQNQGGDAIEYWSFPAHFAKYQEIFYSFFAQRWGWLQEAKPDIRTLLDVGCGYGFFLEYLKNRVEVVHGLELDSKVATYAREHFGLNVESCRIEAFQPDVMFDCIVMCDVLEHVTDPVMVLKRCRDLLSPGGVLFLQVPNLIGFKLPWGHSWGLPHHIWQFGPKNLNRLVAQCGLTPFQWHTGVLGVIGVHERGGPSWRDKLIWSVANKLRLGNRLMVVAIKN
ncbi:MAG: class I SAM-dependent methyltransferase [Magnetococcus sp. YQC-5]